MANNTSPAEPVEEAVVVAPTAPVVELVEVTTDFDFQTNGKNLPKGTHSVSTDVAEDLKRRNDDCLEQERLRFTGSKVSINAGSINAGK